MITSISVNLPPTLRVTDKQFLEFVQANPDLRLERAATGELVVMAPTGSETGSYNSELTADVTIWNRQQGTSKKRKTL